MNPSVFERVVQLYQQRTLREKVLLLVVAVSVVVFPGWFQVLQPQWNQIKTEQAHQQQIREQSRQLQSTIQEIEAHLAADPNQALRASALSLDQQIATLQQGVAVTTQGLVPAAQMTTVLRSVLTQSGGLEIEAMASIPPELLLPAENKVNFYRHGIRLTLKGSYTEIYAYLHQVEQLPQHFYWKRFDYQTEKYPVGKAVVELYTLSQNKEFIGG